MLLCQEIELKSSDVKWVGVWASWYKYVRIAND